MTSQMTYFF